MVKVRLGGWIFRIKNRWQEVEFSEAMELFKADDCMDDGGLNGTHALPEVGAVA